VMSRHRKEKIYNPCWKCLGKYNPFVITLGIDRDQWALPMYINLPFHPIQSIFTTIDGEDDGVRILVIRIVCFSLTVQWGY